MPDLNRSLSRRALLANAAAGAAALWFPRGLAAWTTSDPDRERLGAWTATLRAERLAGPDSPMGAAAIRVGELAEGTPYQPGTLDAYLRGGRIPDREPLVLSLTRFDCVTLVESCLAVARLATRKRGPSWKRFGQEIERMRYRGGVRRDYPSRLHYFSEWISDGERRGLVRDLGPELGATDDDRPLRFMTEHRDKYPALADEHILGKIEAMERRLDGRPRRLIPTGRIGEVADRIETGDVLGFATGIPGLDVTHAAFAYRNPAGSLGVLHAPLSGGVVEIARAALPDYVAAIRRATGILVARPLWG